MAAAILAVMLLSAFFISSHVHHDCTGEDCPVCATIQQCEAILRGFGSSMPGGTILSVPVLLIIAIISLQSGSVTRNTPVSDKVRLND